jgi:hypothetical protein
MPISCFGQISATCSCLAFCLIVTFFAVNNMTDKARDVAFNAPFTQRVLAYHCQSCNKSYSNLFGYDQHRRHPSKRGTLCTSLTMRQEILGMRRADLSTPALLPRTPKIGKPRAALLTSRSCPGTAGDCLLPS